MKELIKLLLVMPGFLEGHFVQALKHMFNVETMKHVQDEDKTTINLRELLEHLSNSFGKEFELFYNAMMFTQTVAHGRLKDYVDKGYMRGKIADEYISMFNMRAFIEKHLLNSEIEWSPDFKEAITEFASIIKSIADYKEIENILIPCRHCIDVKDMPEMHCNVCDGRGEVSQWAYKNADLTDDMIIELETNFAPYAAKFLQAITDYVHYYIAIAIYNEHNSYNNSTTSTFSYNGGSFTIPFKAKIFNGGKFPSDNILVAYDAYDTTFSIPLIVNNSSRVEEPVVEEPTPRFHSLLEKTEVIEQTIKTEVTGEAPVVTKTSKNIYTNQKGDEFTGYNIPQPQWSKYYEGSFGTFKLYFSYAYTRDQVRQAFASLAKTKKADISVKTLNK